MKNKEKDKENKKDLIKKENEEQKNQEDTGKKEKDYEETLNQGADKVKEEDLGTILGKADEILELIGRIDVLRRYTAQAALILRLIKDYYEGRYTDIPWRSIAMAVFALLYLLNPMDLIPDYIPVIGYVDDAAVIALAWKAISGDVRDYVEFKCKNHQVNQRFKDLVKEALLQEC